MRNIVFLCMALVLGACSILRQNELQENKTKWQGAGIAHYRYDLDINCFCSFFQDMPLLIEVHDGEIVAMKFSSGSPIQPKDLAFFEKNGTIDRIFVRLEDNIKENPDYFSAVYDETSGFPVEVQVDYDRFLADDSYTLKISNFEVLP